jgi:NDMA-dependent alcohol dehydrogenase
MRSRAAVLYGVKEEFKVEEIEVDDPRFGEVMVRITATGICHSDHHLVTGDIGVVESAYPMVAGHEGAGVVEKVGEGCTRLKVGDHVVLTFIPSCGHCRWCATGQQMLCDVGAGVLGGRQLDGTTRMHNLQGQELGQWVSISTFSEWTTCPENACVKVADHLPLDKIGLVGCGVPTGVGSSINRANVIPGETVAVFGVGGVGMNAVQGAALAGAARIIAVDLVDFKLEKAAEFGATHFVNARKEDPVEAIKAITNGLGADKSILTVGVVTPDDVGNIVRAVRKGGRAVITAMPKIEYQHINVSPTEIGLFQKELVGSLYGTSNTMYDVPRLLELYEAGKLKVDELITRTYPLEEINQAFDDMLAGKNIRGMVTF